MANAIFGNLTTEGLEKARDTLGGFAPVPTDVYLATITMAYAQASTTAGSKGQSVVLKANIEMPSGETKEYQETITVAGKEGNNFYERDGKKNPLPGFTTIDDLCLCTTMKPLSEQDIEEKTVKVYDYDARVELPKSVPVLVDLIGTKAYFAIEHQMKNKQKLEGGKYVDQADIRELNAIQKVYHSESKQTVTEAREGLESSHLDAWVKKNKGNVRNTVKAVGGTAGAPPTAGAAGAPATPGLFNKS